jgi:hypothetical protein
MILSTEDTDHRLNHPDNLVNKLSIEDEANPSVNKSNVTVLPTYTPAGRPKGSEQVPDKMRELIGSLANKASLIDVSESFDISMSTASNYSRGLVQNSVDPELKARVSANSSNSKIKSTSEAAHESALDMLVDTLSALKPKLSSVMKAKDLSKIATDMSRIVSNLTPKEITNQNNTQVILFAPKQKQESYYDSAEV